jgi:hypothetical protein
MLRNGLLWLKADLRTRGGLLAVGLSLVLTLGVLGFAAGRDSVSVTEMDAEANGEALAEALSEALSEPGTDAAGGAGRVEDTGGDAAGDGATASPEAAGSTSSGAWVSARARSPVEPVPASARLPKPEAVRGIYVGSWSAGSANRLPTLIRLAEETEINTFVVDIKEALGEVSHRTQVPLARQVGADRNPAIADLRGLATRLREHGIYPIARIVVFKDPLLAQARPEWSIRRANGSPWVDDKGVHWVDPFNQDVWDYNIELAREAIALGFSEVQWDYVRFPDVPQSYLRDAVYPARAGRTMADGIREFLSYSRERLDMPDVPQTADVFGIVTTARQDVGIGQVWEKLSDVTDVLLPMVYPSHYPRGTWGHPLPNAAPYHIVKRAMDDAVSRSAAIENAATIRPWLQAFNMGQPPYGPFEIRAQIQAVYDAGLTEWILWSPSARYTREAFADPAGRAPWLGDLRALPPIEYERPAADPPSEPLGSPHSGG